MAKTQRMTVIGDSIAAGWSDPGLTGWAGRVARHFKSAGADVSLVNLAVPGNTTTDILRNNRDDMRPGSTDVLIIGAGINDLCRWGGPQGLQGTTARQRAENWDALLDRAVQSGAHVIVTGLLPVDESRNTPEDGLYHVNDGIAGTNRMIAEKCRARGIDFIDMHDDFARSGVADKLADAVHPNEKGHDWMAGKIRPVVEAALKGLKPGPAHRPGAHKPRQGKRHSKRAAI